MSSRTINLEELFKPEMESTKLNIFFGGRTTAEYVEPTPSEIADIDRVINLYATLLRKTSPSLAAEFERHRPIFHKFAGVAKAVIPGRKPIQFPSQTGGLGVLPLFPQAVKYVATASADNPAYTSYATNSWEISLTAGTAAYILGDGTNHYKASPANLKKAFLVICQNGLLEIGTSPRIIQQRMWTQAESKYGIWPTSILKEIPIEHGKTIYQYETVGVLPVYHDFGVMWKILPELTGTSKLPLMGLIIYEHDLFPDTKWVA